MFRKSRRLRLKNDIDRVFKKGRSFFTRDLGAKVLANELDHARFLVVAGKKVDKSAVSRNRVKRRIRAMVKKHIDKIRPGYDVMLVAQAGLKDKDNEEMENELLYVLRKLNLFK